MKEQQKVVALVHKLCPASLKSEVLTLVSAYYTNCQDPTQLNDLATRQEARQEIADLLVKRFKLFGTSSLKLRKLTWADYVYLQLMYDCNKANAFYDFIDAPEAADYYNSLPTTPTKNDRRDINAAPSVQDRVINMLNKVCPEEIRSMVLGVVDRCYIEHHAANKHATFTDMTDAEVAAYSAKIENSTPIWITRVLEALEAEGNEKNVFLFLQEVYSKCCTSLAIHGGPTWHVSGLMLKPTQQDELISFLTSKCPAQIRARVISNVNRFFNELDDVVTSSGGEPALMGNDDAKVAYLAACPRFIDWTGCATEGLTRREENLFFKFLEKN